MTGHNPGEARGDAPLPMFIPFDARAKAAGIIGLDEAIERSGHPENMFTIADLANVTPAIAIPYSRILCGEDRNGYGAAVAYNGFYFAAVIGSYLIGNVGTPTPPPYPGIIREVGDDESKRRQMLAESGAYLEDKPTIEEWIGRYFHVIDQTGGYPEVATTVTALTLRDIERNERQGFIEAEVHLQAGELRPPES